MDCFDVGIIGAGVAGAFSALTLTKANKNIKTIIFDLGRPPLKRRRQLEGWLGCLPNSDGKLYSNDIKKITNLVGSKKAKAAHINFNKTLSNISKFKLIEDSAPSASVQKRLQKYGYEFSCNNYTQMYPKDIHMLSKHMSEIIDQNKNMTFSFDNEVKQIFKVKDTFTVITELQEYQCKKLIIAVGRSGWRWARDLYNSFGIIDNNDIAKFGIRIEMNSSHMKDFNKSNCTITKGNDLEIGPLSWGGTIIPEDHIDMAISAFRANENRWESDKISFAMIGSRPFPNSGFEQTNRLGQLTFVLANDRIIKEKVNSILTGKSKISIMNEYNWLKDNLIDLQNIIPDLISKAYFHVPTILPFAPTINIDNNLCSDIDGMFVAGESAGISGILAAACSGIIAAENVIQ